MPVSESVTCIARGLSVLTILTKLLLTNVGVLA